MTIPIPIVPVGATDSPIYLRITSGKSQPVAGVVWRFAADASPLGKAGDFTPINAQVPLGASAAIAGQSFVVQGTLLTDAPKPDATEETATVVITVEQEGKILHRALPALSTVAGAGTFPHVFLHTLGIGEVAGIGAPAVHLRRARLRTVLWIHGMGDSEGGFSEDLYRQLVQGAETDAEVGRIRHAEVLYESENKAVAAKIKNVDLKIGKFLADKASALAALAGIEDPDLSGFQEGVEGAMGDVGGMVMSTGARHMVLTKMTGKLLDLVTSADGQVSRSGHTIDIVCHSLGTFMTYELLHHITDPVAGRGVRPSDEVRIRKVFMLAPVLALIRDLKLFNITPSTENFATKRNPFTAPVVVDRKGVSRRIGEEFWAFRHVVDPFASIRVTDGPFLDGKEPAEFADFLPGNPNMHAYANYLERFRKDILAEIMED